MKFGVNRHNRATPSGGNYKKIAALLMSSINELQHRGLDVADLPQEVRRGFGGSEVTWRQAALAIDDSDLAEQAYSAVCRQINIDHYICRVYLDDLAELLVLSPLVYRRIRRDACSPAGSQIAA
jgi:hypothetical protein